MSFLLFVALPVVLATLYYGCYASNQHVAEFKFAVRDSWTSVSSTDSGRGGILSLLGVNTPPNTPENHIVTDYLLSWHVVEYLLAEVDLRQMYSREGTDW